MASKLPQKSASGSKVPPRPLVRAHATPRNNAKLPCVPLAYRRKSDGFRPNMDRLIENDTKDFHWCLSKSESQSFLEKLFPDSLLFGNSRTTVSNVLTRLRARKSYVVTEMGEEWAGFPETKGDDAEENVATFLNRVLQAVDKISGKRTKRRWHARGAKKFFAGSFVQRKPDLVLSSDGAEEDWRDVVVFGELKNQKTTETSKTSFTEIAGKASVLLYAQDGRHAVPCLRILGSDINLTFFDRGGVLETHLINIHEDPEIFLRILLGLSNTSLSQLGFDVSLLDKAGNKRVLIAWRGGRETVEITIENLIFISDVMNGRGTTVWRGSMDISDGESNSEEDNLTWPRTRRGVVVKDSWIDPLRKYTEGTILTMLNEAGVVGVPTLIHEEQVQTPHPTRPNVCFNNSTHLFRALLSEPSRNAAQRNYQLRILSRLVTTPVGTEILKFSSLAELLVAFIDYILTHKDAVEKACVLHRDVSLLNLLLVLWDGSCGTRLEFLDALPDEMRQRLRRKIQTSVAHRGLFTDWGYAVPIERPPSQPATRPPTPDSSDWVDIDIASFECGKGAVPALNHDDNQPQTVQYVPISKLGSCHEVKVQMAGEPPDPNRPSIDTNPLYRTGTWSWMAAELVLAGPGMPVVHHPAHDLESIFYVLVGISVLLDRPHQIKPEDRLSCFDKYFNSFHPSISKTTTIQSKLGWSFNILPNISPYFRPLIPLLNKLREKIILPMEFSDGRLVTGGGITHDFMLDAFLEALCNLEDQYWEKISAPRASRDKPSRRISPALSSNGSESSEPCFPSRIPRPGPIRPISGSGFTSVQSGYSSGSLHSNRRRLSGAELNSSSQKRARPSPRSSLLRVQTASTSTSYAT